MTSSEFITVLLSVISLLLIPAVGLLIRGAVKWTRTEDRLAELVRDVGHLVEDKDRVHAAMLEQMAKDREAADRRFRFIEEAWMMMRGPGR